MKKLLFAFPFLSIFILIIFQLQAQQTNQIDQFDDGIATVGDTIDHRLASRWMDNYSKLNPDNPTGHLFGRDVLERILSQDDAEGIRIYYAIDNSGVNPKQALVLVGVNKDNEDIPNLMGDRSIPCGANCGQKKKDVKNTQENNNLITQNHVARVGGVIHNELAYCWMDNFQKRNPEKIKGHLFGKEILVKILSQKDAEGIRMYYSIDDSESKNKPALILVAVNSDNEDIPEILGDRSLPCGQKCTGQRKKVTKRSNDTA